MHVLYTYYTCICVFTTNVNYCEVYECEVLQWIFCAVKAVFVIKEITKGAKEQANWILINRNF